MKPSGEPSLGPAYAPTSAAISKSSQGIPSAIDAVATPLISNTSRMPYGMPPDLWVTKHYTLGGRSSQQPVTSGAAVGTSRPVITELPGADPASSDQQNQTRRMGEPSLVPLARTPPQGNQSLPQTRYYLAPNVDTATIGQHLLPGWCVGADYREHFSREYPEYIAPR